MNNKTRALMLLTRLPTEAELEATGGMEAHAFLNSFNNMAESGFRAHVVDKGDHVILDGWSIPKMDWYSVVFAGEE